MAQKININTAGIDELTELPGIGSSLAERILEYRVNVGRFRTVEELAAVSGITDRDIDRFKDRLVVDAEEDVVPDLPPMKVQIILKDGAQADYTGHRILASYTYREWLPSTDDQPTEIWLAGQTSVDLPQDGEATVTFPNQADLKNDVNFEVHAPDGEVLYTEAIAAKELVEKLEWTVKPKEYAKIVPNDDPNFDKPTRLKGRVIDRAGQKQIARSQLVVWGAQKEDPTDDDFRALLVAQTDNLGYFSGPYPLGEYSAAHGTVTVGEKLLKEPIHLQEDKTFPEHIILVVDLDDAIDDDECGCCKKKDDVPRDPDMADLGRADGTYSNDPGAGKCVDFTKPDRTLDEFTFSYAVRTTEPVIKGLTLEEPKKIDLSIIAKLIPTMAAGGTGTGIEGVAVKAHEPKTSFATDKIDARILHTLARDPDGFSLTKVANAADLTLHGDILRVIAQHIPKPPGRERMNCSNPVDWDDEPTIYQACTIAHGHILRFKQEWVADGYSLGNLLYSLPLAPGQKKQIAVIDWERREVAARTEAIEEEEELEAFVSRDRDINEIVTGSVSESVRGGSKSRAGSFAGGLGIGAILGPVGGLLGIGGGTSSASSSAWQNSSRRTSANALNQLRDRTIQSASSLRSQRSTVVQTVRQGERMIATTETVANYNHCHALSIQYFEVLRHLLVRQRLVDVQECLFVPLLLSRFTSDKALRWSNTLRPVVRSRHLRRGLDAIERIKNNYAGSDFPTGAYADQDLVHLEGDLYLRFELARPRDTEEDFDPDAWLFLQRLFPFISAADFYKQYLKGQELKDKVFQEQMAPRIAERFVQHLQFFAVDHNEVKTKLPVDTTLLTDFVNARPLYVSLRLSGALPTIARKDIKHIEISDLSGILNLPFLQLLPAGSKVIVESGNMRYRTEYSSDYLFRDYRIRNDLLGGDIVRIFTPLNRRELRNPRKEDKELSRQLLDHLNEHIEHYHHAIWWRMSPDRRYMLLDGFETPNGGGRSVASVVENELLGIVGNTLIMPVAPGFHLDPTFRQDLENPIDLLEHYQPDTPVEPTRIAIPTRGVYAEAVMGACNSCEFKEEERFWRWQESPIPDAPPEIMPVSTESRRAEPPDLTAKDFPSPMINLQNAPAAPDPTGLGAVLQLLGTPNLFKDITGLEGTQRNVAAALQGAFDTAKFFGGKASDMALQGKMARDIDKTMRTIQTARENGMINEEQARELSNSAIRGMIGAGPSKPKPSLSEQPEVRKLIDKSGDKAGESKVNLERKENGTSEAVNISSTTSSSPLAALFGAGARPTTIGTRSTKSDAIAHITQCRASTATSPWKLDRTKMLDRLEEIVNDPSLIDQDKLNVCGPAAFLRVWIARDPLSVAKFACELYDTGKSTINSYAVEPGSDSLIAEDYAALDAAHADFIPEAEWMILGSLRDAENFFFDFEGKPEEDASAGTTPGEIADWLEVTGLYAHVKDEGNFFLTKGLEHARGLKPSSSRDIILLINAHMLKQMNVTSGTKKSDEFILSAFPNHFIVLTSEIKDAADDKLQFNYWTWGQQYSGTIEKAIFEANYYGAVIGEGAAP